MAKWNIQSYKRKIFFKILYTYLKPFLYFIQNVFQV